MGRKRMQTTGVDGFARTHALVALGIQSEVDHHDRVLLHHAHQHDQAHERVQVQLPVKQRQRQQRAKQGRGKSGKNGDGMDEALIQNPEDDVDHQDRDDQQNGQAAEGAFEFPHGSLETHAQGLRHVHLPHDGVQLIGRLAQRNSGREIEGDSHRRKLAEMVHRQRAHSARALDQRIEGDERPCRRAHV